MRWCLDRRSCTSEHSAAVGLAKFGNGEVLVKDERSLSFLDWCGESVGVCPEPDDRELGETGPTDADRARLPLALGDISA
jgi:hypothetical protein